MAIDWTVWFCGHWIGALVRCQSVSFNSNFFADQQLFPKDSIEFDHALIMRDLRHEWRQADDLYALPKAATYG